MKKIISVLLALAIMLNMMPIVVAAEDEEAVESSVVEINPEYEEAGFEDLTEGVNSEETEPEETEPEETEPEETEPEETEPEETEPEETEPEETEPEETEPEETEPEETEPEETEPEETEPEETEPEETEPEETKPEETKPGEAEPEETEPEKAESEETEPEDTEPEETEPEETEPEETEPEEAEPEEAEPEETEPEETVPEEAEPEEAEPEETEPEETEPEEAESEEAEPEEAEPEEAEPEETEPEEAKATETENQPYLILLKKGTVLYTDEYCHEKKGTLAEDAVVTVVEAEERSAEIRYAEKTDTIEIRKAFVKPDALIQLNEAETAKWQAAVHSEYKEFNEFKLEPVRFTDAEETAPGEEEPAQEEPTQEEPAQEEPAQEEPAQEEPAQEEPAQEEPVQEEPAQEEPAQEEPAQEEPTQEEPAQEEPAQEEPAQEEPVQEEPAQEEEQKKAEESKKRHAATQQDNALPKVTIDTSFDSDYQVFTVHVSDATGAVRFSWYYSSDGGSSWNSYSTYYSTTAEDYISVYTSSYTNCYFKCTVKVNGVEVDSASLPVIGGRVECSPSYQTVKIGDKFTLYANYYGSDAVGYQWQYSNDAGKTWKNCTSSGNNTSAITLTANSYTVKYLYRCLILMNGLSRPSENSVYVIAAVATSSAASAKYGAKVTFTVQCDNASGDVSYQWQVSKDNGASWENSVGTTAKKTVTVYSYTPGYLFRCIVTASNGTFISNTVKVNGQLSAKVSKTKIAVSFGKTAKISVTPYFASGTVTYQWQYSSDQGKTWKNSGCTGNKTKTLSVTIKESTVKLRYRCVIKAGGKTAASAAATFFSAQATPATKSTKVGATVKFTATPYNTSGTVTYQWQFSKDKGKTWTNSGTTGSETKTLTISKISSTVIGYYYRCKVTCSTGTIYTNTCKMTGLLTAYIAKTKIAISFGKTAKISVTPYFASGTVTYQWQYSSDQGKTWTNSNCTGNKTKTLSVAIKASTVKLRYRCVIKAGGKTAASAAVTFFSAQGTPATKSTKVGEKVTFTATPYNTSGTVTYQWQFSKDQGKTWTNSGTTGNKTKTLTISKVTSTIIKYYYRCKVTCSTGTIYTNICKMKGPLTASISKTKIAVSFGKTAKISVTPYFASGTVTYQWQYSSDQGKTWKNSGCTGNKTKTLSVTIKESTVKLRYRCVIKAGGKTAASAAATFFSAQATPAAKSVKVGATVKLTATKYNTSGTVTYQWQFSKDQGKTWTNSGATGNKTNTLTLSNISATVIKYYYRCKVTCSTGTIYTNTCKMTGLLTAYIAKTRVPISFGKTAKISVTPYFASGTVTYQWQYSSDQGKTWTNSGATGNKTKTLSVAIKASTVKLRYRCVIKAGGKTAASAAVTFFSAQGTPATKTTKVGESVTFTATPYNTSGTVTYQWQFSKDKGTTWTNSGTTGNKTKTLTISKVSSTVIKYYYRCKVTCSTGTIYTNICKMKGPLAASITKGSTGASIGSTVQFITKTEYASGSITYTWQYSTNNGSTWSTASSLTGAKPSFTLAESNLMYLYRCVVKDSTSSVTTNSIRLIDFTLAATKPVYRALLVGERAFSPYCARNGGDVVHMASMLGGTYGPGGTKYSVTEKYDLTKDQIMSAIQSTFSGTKDTDVSLFMIASHGVVSVASGSGAGAIATMSSNLYFNELASWLNTYVKGKVIVIIETCGSGSAIYDPSVSENKTLFANDADEKKIVQEAISAFASADHSFTVETTEAAENEDGKMIFNTGELRVPNKFYVLAAARHQEYSYGEYETGYASTQDESGNVFINGLVKGVGNSSSSPADKSPKNKVITLEELFKYCVSYAQNWSQKFDPDGWYDPNDPYTWNIDPNEAQHTQRYPKNSNYSLFMFP